MPAPYTYDPNIPSAGHAPKDDQPAMKTNATSIQDLIEVDHIGFDNNQGGAHNQCQISSQSSINGAIPSGLLGNGFETLYSSNTNTQGELWFVRGATPTGIQLTGPGTPIVGSSNLSNGKTFLPGGVLLQWGSFTPGSATSTYNVSFPTAFPNFVYNVNFIGASANTGFYLNGAPTESGFSAKTLSGNTSQSSIFWIAIGS